MEYEKMKLNKLIRIDIIKFTHLYRYLGYKWLKKQYPEIF